MSGRPDWPLRSPRSSATWSRSLFAQDRCFIGLLRCPTSPGSGPALSTFTSRSPTADSTEVTADVPMEFGFADRASAFARLDPELPAGCARRSLLAEAWARAGLYGVDAGANDALASSTAAYIAWLVEPCEAMVIGEIDDYRPIRNRPYRAKRTRAAPCSSPGSSRRNTGLPTRSTCSTHSGCFPSNALRRTASVGSTVQTSSMCFEVCRRTAEQPSATCCLSTLPLGLCGRSRRRHSHAGQHVVGARRARTIRGSHRLWLPAEVGSPRSADRTFGRDLHLDRRQGRAKNASIGFRAEWETPTVFRFSFLKIGADGTELSRSHPSRRRRHADRREC